MPAVAAGAIGLLALVVLIGISAGRGLAINRAMSTDLGQDMRGLGLTTVLRMIREYFPFGSGLGGFDTLFRLHEPDFLLDPTYFNHAHDDALEIVLDAGLLGAALLATALLWLAAASVKAWRTGHHASRMQAGTGALLLLLTVGASLFDYPARTPTIMAVTMIAAVWLSEATEVRRGSALPESKDHL